MAFTFQREYFEIENSHNEMKKIQNFIFYNFESHILEENELFFQIIEMICIWYFNATSWIWV